MLLFLETSMKLEKLDIARINEAFSPAREIDDPTHFVGRPYEITKGIEALSNPGGFLVFYGLRGVGKSSIARQICRIASGDMTLPKALDVERLIPSRGFNFKVHYFQCDKFVVDVKGLLKRLLFGDEDNASLFSLTTAGERRLAEFKRAVRAEGGFSFFGTKIGASGTEDKTYKPYVSDDEIQQFRQLLGTIRKDNQNKSGLLILIDEFDTLEDKTGFASIVKACSSEYVKFGVVGIAGSVSELINDHESIGRQIDMIRVPLMPEHECKKILKKAEWLVGNAIIFEDDAADSIARLAEGFPYFVHLLGKEAMLLAFRRKSNYVTQHDIDNLFETIAEGRLGTIYEDIYHRAVKTSVQRELLLKLFSEQTADEINTEPVYTAAKGFEITNPSQLMKELTADTHGSPVLTKVRERYYRFTDPVFKVYARMRQWKMGS
jgi:hypothetical protein